MIHEIVLETFKCFERLSLPLAPLTLLTGVNAGGKSTVQQALLLLHQGIVERPATHDLVLSGPSVTLGLRHDDVAVPWRGT
jgi:predicted ATPase